MSDVDLSDAVHPAARGLRVLHIGNIANNGYGIAKLFNRAGIPSDLLVGPYYHFAGCPEWEDAEFDGDIGDQFFPLWHRVKIMNGFSRPDWVVQGDWAPAIEYLLAVKRGQSQRAKMLRWRLKLGVFLISMDNNKPAFFVPADKGQSFNPWFFAEIVMLLLAKIFGAVRRALINIRRFIFKDTRNLLANTFVERLLYVLLVWPLRHTLRRFKHGVRDTGSAGTEGQDAILPLGDYPFSQAEYQSMVRLSRRMLPLFEHYDVVIGYATSGIWPFWADKPYLAYEHGTIRTIPFEQDLQGRMCKVTYQAADAVIMSNFDSNGPGEKLGLQKYRAIPHQINEIPVDEAPGRAIRRQLLAQYDAEFILYNPSRQHWSDKADPGWEKGNDILIRALAVYNETPNTPRLMAVFSDWGVSVEDSKALIEKLGISHMVHWVDPVPHKQMIEYIQASDVVSDQFLLPTFGGIPAKALMHGRPVITKFSPEMHQWCFEKMPPFLPADTSEEIASALSTILGDPEAYAAAAKSSREWYAAEHSNRTLIERMSAMLAEVAQERGIVPPPQT